MLEIIETGTDIARVCFFDPGGWPAAHQKRQNTPEFFQKLFEEGRLWFTETGADGAYLFHFYLDEEIPERIKVHSEDSQEISIFQVPSGVVVACGTEYASADPQKADLAKHAHMGASFKLPAGNYAVKVWRTEWPEDMIEDAVKERLGKKSVESTNRLGVCTGVLFFTTVICSIGAVFKTLGDFGNWGVGVKLLWGFLIISWPTLIFLIRKLSRMTKNPARSEVERQFPSIVVQMHKITSVPTH